MEAFCSLYLVEREINDPLRRFAAAEAAVSRYSDMKSCWDGDVSKRTSAEGYEILCPDPLEDAKTIYVDVKVSVLDIEDDQEKVTRALKVLGPWVPEKDIRFITREEDRARVDVDPCYERYHEFYRRVSLFNLAKLISDMYKDRRKDLVDELFETPAAITEENSLMSLTNRSRFTKEVLQDWFFDLDTYSKCITLVEAFSRNLHLVDAPVRLDIYDVYCKTYTRVNRLVHLNMIDKSDIKTQLRELSVLGDVKATPVDNVLANFLSFGPDVHYFDNNMSKRFDREDGVAVFGDLFKTLTEMIPLKASSSSQQPTKKRLKTSHETEIYTVKNGYSSCGKSIEPFSISMRKKAILPSEGSLLRKQLLFPVYSSDSPGDVLFFVKPKKTTVTTLFLPGLFRSRGQFLSGDCKGLVQSSSSDDIVKWRYTLADYTPIRGGGGTDTAQEKRNRSGLYASSKSGSSKISVLLPLYF
uniref:Wsv415-like protein n=1 Tax=Hemigrapsus takanoi nimavirus TaxID=2133792 RepID=A0A401IP18_9VIRU|nr:MAG: wsv415-like protein [Hemigrapsus takanoi nimavirus]GBG35340.1 wsv415-like protein [Hemigrapsus takanoi nimavirus]